jgi:4a-hydroxytetrahydrobiopterin dehydratase
MSAGRRFLFTGEHEHMAKLDESQIASGVAAMPEWSFVNGKLHREYKFPEFSHAIGFRATAAPAIEKMNHHPEWANVYNRVTVDLMTHDAGGITKKDFELAALLESIAKKLL